MFTASVLLAAAVCIPAPPAEHIAAQIAARAELDAAGTPLNFLKKWEEEVTDSRPAQRKHWKQWNATGAGVVRYHQRLTHSDGKPTVNPRSEEKSQDPRREFLGRYTLSLADECGREYTGRLHWLVAFRPRTDAPQPSGDDRDDLLNRMSGIMYVDARLWFIRSATAILKTPYSIFIIGRMNGADMLLEQDEFNGVVVTRTIVANINFSSWGRQHRKRISYHYSDFSVPTP